MNEPRKPAAFRLDDPNVVVAARHEDDAAAHSPRAVVVNPEKDQDARALPLAPLRRRFAWATVLFCALLGLLAMAAGLSTVKLLESLFARTPWLGWTGAALAGAAAIAFIAIIIREVRGLMRLAEVEKLHERAAEAIAKDNRDEARSVAKEIISFSRASPWQARGRAALEAHLDDIIDGADLVRLAEREMMAPLDREARRLVSDAAKRVSLVTAVSPRAAVDMAFVLFTAVRLIRRLAELYGGRPGTLGMIRLVRMVLAHLAVTGGMAASDSLVQQVLGHGLAAKLSARLGEGVLNGMLTARLGLAAIEVARPLPFVALPPPTMTDLASGLLKRRADGTLEPQLPVS
ncbi:MAG: TIGR01620 family protein [Rhizobiales bacterium]|nr:TIGR01620 family protein [Hyphomicrobiales bacterium]